MMKIDNLAFGDRPLTIEDVVSVALGNVACELSSNPGFRSAIEKGAAFLDDMWKRESVIYGVTTGVGDSVVRPIPEHLVPEFPLHLSRFHGCGLGRVLSEPQVRAVLAVRIASLCRGVSGVRWELLERLVAYLQLGIHPRIPEEGSVGASGDLTPLSYIAATLFGEREVFVQGELRPTMSVLAEHGLEPLALRPKEALAIMNGTSVMTALACLAFDRAQRLSQLATRITSLVSLAMLGNKAHFDTALFALKPYVGQARVASRIASDIAFDEEYTHPREERLQDTYAVRCAPHIIGVLEDAMQWCREWIEIELNSANDNPLLLADEGRILHGGHFYGGHMAFAMDALKTAIANVADLMDRQVALLVNEKSNRGLPSNLSGANGDRQSINHAFKAAHIATSAWAAEALKLTMPASVFSRSTESHNQDKVSMGTIAARDCLRVLELTEQVAVTTLLASIQAFELRAKSVELHCHPRVRDFVEVIRAVSPFIEEDRPLESELRALLALLGENGMDFSYGDS